MKRMKIVLAGLVLVLLLSGALLKGGEEYSVLTPEEQRIGYLARLPTEKIIELAYHLADPNRPLESLQEVQRLLELRDDTVGFLYDEAFMFALLDKVTSKKDDRLVAGEQLRRNIITFIRNVDAEPGYLWLAREAKKNQLYRTSIKSVLNSYIHTRIQTLFLKRPFHYTSKNSITAFRLLDIMLAQKVYSPDEFVGKNQLAGEDYLTAYYSARAWGDEELARLFLYYGANPNKLALSPDELYKIILQTEAQYNQ